MKDHEKPDFHNALAALCASFGREPDAATVAAYWMALNDLPARAVILGFRDAVRSAREFMPAAGAVRALAQTHIRMEPDKFLGPPRRPNLGDGDAA